MNAERPSQALMGLTVSLVGAIVLTAFASVSPAGVRKLVLFAVAFGLSMGGIVAAASIRYAMSRRLALLLVPVLVVSGLLVVAVRTHRQYQSLQRAENVRHPDRVTPAPMLEAIAANDPETAAMLRRERQEDDPDFLHYLAVRTRPLGEWVQPWPVVFWGNELLLATLAGVFVVHRMVPRDHPSGEPIDVDADTV